MFLNLFSLFLHIISVCVIPHITMWGLTFCSTSAVHLLRLLCLLCLLRLPRVLCLLRLLRSSASSASRLPSPVSINLCLSTSLYRLVSINLSLSTCLYQLVSINLSLPNCLYQLVCIHFSASTWRGTWGHYSWSIAAIVAGDAAGRRGGLAAVRCRDCRRGRG